MPRGGARPGAGRPKKQPEEVKPSKKAALKTAPPQVDSNGYKGDPKWPFGKQLPPKPEPPPDLSDLMPLDYLLEVMRDHTEERGRRMQAATLAAPYCHPKKGEAGKKEEKTAAAKKIASRFAPAAPPKLVASGGKNI